MTGQAPDALPAEVVEPEPVAVKVPRLRSPRTVAAVLVAVAVLLVGAALLYDVIAVRTGHAARRWRAEVADELATRHLDDFWVLLGAGAAVLLGGWLLWLALAPGLRRWLPLRPHGGTSAAIDRTGVGHLLHDRAAGLPGIEHLTVRINRRRVKVALTGPADPASVQRQLRAELARVTLARPLRLDVRAKRGRGRAAPCRGHHRRAPRALRRAAGPARAEGAARSVGSAGLAGPARPAGLTRQARQARSARPGEPGERGAGRERAAEYGGAGAGRTRRGLMSRSTVNRVLLGVAAVLLLAAGALVLAGGLDLYARLGLDMPGWWPLTSPDQPVVSAGSRTRWADESWWWPAVIAGLALVVAGTAWWLLAQLRRSGPATIALPTPGASGLRLRLRTRALEEALETGTVVLPEVERVSVRLLRGPRRRGCGPPCG